MQYQTPYQSLTHWGNFGEILSIGKKGRGFCAARPPDKVWTTFCLWSAKVKTRNGKSSRKRKTERDPVGCLLAFGVARGYGPGGVESHQIVHLKNFHRTQTSSIGYK